MKYILVAVLLLHGLIHFLGTAKAFGWASVTQLSKGISKPVGLLWLITALLFMVSVILLLSKNGTWWIACMAAIVLSQVLIAISWSDAKYGTVINVVVLLVAVTGFAQWNFYNKYKTDVIDGLRASEAEITDVLREQDIQHLPVVVQKYIRYSGSLNKPKVKSFRVEMSGHIRQDEEGEWMPFTTVQYNFLEPATRLFYMNAKMKSLPVKGFHRYVNGTAVMDIRLLSLVKVQYEKGAKMNVSETVTFFNDMCCLAPATLIDKRVKWLASDSTKAKAEFTINGITISAWLYINDKGELVNFVSEDRYAKDKKGLIRLPWSTPLTEYRNFNGYTLPGYADLIYSYPNKDMCYGKFRILSTTYNVKELK